MFALGDPPPYTLDRAPLRQALAQVRFPLQARLASLAGLGEFQDALGQEFNLSETRGLDVEAQFSPDGVTGEAHETVTWTFSPAEGPQVVITPGSLTLSTNGIGYRGFEDFEVRFMRCLTILKQVVGVHRCERLGARYLSVAEIAPGFETAWSGWFRPEVIGWSADASVLSDSTALNMSMAQTILEERPATGPTVRAVVRHGVVPAESIIPGIPAVTTATASLVLDLDLFAEGSQDLNVEVIGTQFHDLHADIDRFFSWSLTDTGRNHFGWRPQP